MLSIAICDDDIQTTGKMESIINCTPCQGHFELV